MALFILLMILLTLIIMVTLGWFRSLNESLDRLPIMPLSEIRRKLGITEHVTTVIVNGTPVYFDYSGKEIK